jgi:hypothetical protein
VLGLVWMFISYNLRKKSMEYQYRYKKDVVDKTGLIILDDDRVMDRDGKVLSGNDVPRIEHDDDDNNDAILIE